PIKNYYLACISRGCPYTCTYCSLSYEGKEIENLGGKRFRERSVKNVIDELLYMKKRYNYDWIDFRNSVFSSSEKWTIEFCELYKKKIGLPFRIFSHPQLITDASTKALKEANCFAIQIGLESYDEYVRCEILNRKYDNEEVHKACEILERNKACYSLDYILGLPGQIEDELERAAEFFCNLKYCYRISPFMIQYLPKLDIIKHGIRYNMIDEEEVTRIEQGYHGNYMANGSLTKEQIKSFNAYRILFRTMGFVPPIIRKLLYKSRIFKVGRYLPANLFLSLLDLYIIMRDIDARSYLKNYIWWIRKRFNSKHPAYFRYGKLYKNYKDNVYKNKKAA
ncbi:unnamed protein product, partial [marine sediment metagenome]